MTLDRSHTCDEQEPTRSPLVLPAADAGERVDITRNRWDGGWHEGRQVRVESIEAIEWDEAAVGRAALVDEITF